MTEQQIIQPPASPKRQWSTMLDAWRLFAIGGRLEIDWPKAPPAIVSIAGTQAIDLAETLGVHKSALGAGN